MTLTWSAEPTPVGRGKFALLLEFVREHQADHPDEWAHLQTYSKRKVAADTAYRLRKKHRDFDFRVREEGNGWAVEARLREDG